MKRSAVDRFVDSLMVVLSQAIELVHDAMPRLFPQALGLSIRRAYEVLGGFHVIVSGVEDGVDTHWTLKVSRTGGITRLD